MGVNGDDALALCLGDDEAAIFKPRDAFSALQSLRDNFLLAGFEVKADEPPGGMFDDVKGLLILAEQQSGGSGKTGGDLFFSLPIFCR